MRRKTQEVIDAKNTYLVSYGLQLINPRCPKIVNHSPQRNLTNYRISKGHLVELNYLTRE